MKKDDEEKEDVTKYGEFISSYFAWVPPEKQKKKVDRKSTRLNSSHAT